MATPDDFCKTVGLIAIQFSTLDFAVTVMLNNLITEHHEAAAIITNDITSLRAKLELSANLAKVKLADPKLKKDFADFCKAALKHRDWRNRLLHDLWIFEEPGLTRGEIKRQELRRLFAQGFKFNPVVHTLDELQRFSDELAKFISRTLALYDRMPGAKPCLFNHSPATE